MMATHKTLIAIALLGGCSEEGVEICVRSRAPADTFDTTRMAITFLAAPDGPACRPARLQRPPLFPYCVAAPPGDQYGSAVALRVDGLRAGALLARREVVVRFESGQQVHEDVDLDSSCRAGGTPCCEDEQCVDGVCAAVPLPGLFDSAETRWAPDLCSSSLAEPISSDLDGDGVWDAADSCPSYANADQGGAVCEPRVLDLPEPLVTAHLSALLPDGTAVLVGSDAANQPEAILFGPGTSAADDRFDRASTAGSAHEDGVVVPAPGGPLFVGGRDATLSDLVERFDPQGLGFVEYGRLSVARAKHDAVLLANGRLVVIGGVGVTGPLATLEILDARGSAVPPIVLPPEGAAPIRPAAIWLRDGRVLITGGCDPEAGPTDAAAVFDPDHATIDVLPETMSAPRWGHRMFLLGTGGVLVIGGRDDPCEEPPSEEPPRPTREVELFDPEIDSFTTLCVTEAGHAEAAAVGLADGSVLLLGGVGEDGSPHWMMTRVESDGTSRTVDHLMRARSGLQRAAVLLRDGSVLVAGGEASEAPASTVERVFPEYFVAVDADGNGIVDVLDED